MVDSVRRAHCACREPATKSDTADIPKIAVRSEFRLVAILAPAPKTSALTVSVVATHATAYPPKGEECSAGRCGARRLPALEICDTSV